MESAKEIDLIITLLAGVLVMLIMTTAIVFSVIQYQKKVIKQKEILRNAETKYQNDLLNATITASDRERESVAKNIHDDIGALTNLIKLNNNRLKNNLANEIVTLELIKTNNDLLLEINDNIRAISNDLASPTLNKFGFIRAFEQLCVQISYANFIKVEIDFEEVNVKFERKAEIQLFRICKEVLNNILKHSNAKEININLTFDQDSLTISVKHDGTGVSDEEVKMIMENNKGLGLKSVYSRVQILEGKINYFAQKGEGSRVLIQIPIKKEE